MLPRGVFTCSRECGVFCFLCYHPPTTQTTHVNCTCVPCSSHPGGARPRVCVCVQKFAGKFSRGSLQRAFVNRSADSLNRFAYVPTPLRSAMPMRFVPKGVHKHSPKSLCKLELKLLVCNTHPQASPCGERLMLSVVHFLRKCRQMTSHHVELMCGATPLSNLAHS